MNYELVSIKTKDKLDLYGILKESKRKNAILIHIHGTASNFYEEDFMEQFAKELPNIGISVLSTNNRGAYVYDSYQKSGGAVEKFEDCVIDVDEWIKFAMKKSFNKIILSGHSLGTEKIVYYMTNGTYVGKVSSIILLAPADSWGYHRHNETYEQSEYYEKKINAFLKKAKKLISERKGDEFLDRYSYGEVMPKSASSFVDFLDEKSELLKALPFSLRKLDNYRKINVPIFVAIGDKKEFTAIPIKEALKLMNKENSRTETHQIKNCNHDFEGKEEELTNLIKQFLDNIKF